MPPVQTVVFLQSVVLGPQYWRAKLQFDSFYSLLGVGWPALQIKVSNLFPQPLPPAFLFLGFVVKHWFVS